jgi:Uncharacterised nucleotidyltransferase
VRSKHTSERNWPALLGVAQLLSPDFDRTIPHNADFEPRDLTDWIKVLRVASDHFCAPTISEAALCDARAPDQIERFFHAAFTLNDDRSRRLLDALANVLAGLNARGMEPILLKGAAALATGLYKAPGRRFLSDIDLLFPTGIVETARSCLLASGLVEMAGDVAVPAPLPFDSADTQNRPRADQPIGSFETGIWFELHDHILDSEHGGKIRAADLLSASVPITFAGQRCRVLSPAHQLFHNAIHRQVIDEGYALRQIDLRQLYEFVLLARRHGPAALAQAYQLAVLSDWAREFDGWVDLANAVFDADLPLAGPGRGFAAKVARQYENPRPRILIDPGFYVRRLALNIANPEGWRRLLRRAR